MVRWLDDDRLRIQLNSDEPAQISEALVILEARMRELDYPELPPLNLRQLAPVAATNDYDEGARMVELVLRNRHQDLDQALDTVATLAAEYLGPDPQYAVALELKVQPDPVRAVTHVLAAIGAQLEQLPLDRARPIGFLIDNLLDGEPAVVAATWAALRSWPAVPLRDAVLAAAEVDLEAGRRSFEGA